MYNVCDNAGIRVSFGMVQEALKDNAKWHEADEKARQAREEKARRDRELREREAKQRALVDVSVEDEQQGVMDNLLEALKSGSAFNVSRHNPGTPAHKRTPRWAAAGRPSSKHNSTPSATEQELTSPTTNAGGSNSTNSAIGRLKAAASAQQQNGSKTASAADESSSAAAAIVNSSGELSTNTVIRLNRKSDASALSHSRPPSEGAGSSTAQTAASHQPAKSSNSDPNAGNQQSSQAAMQNAENRQREPSSSRSRKQQDAGYQSLSKAHHPAALKAAQQKHPTPTSKSPQPQLSLAKDQQQHSSSAMSSSSQAIPNALPAQVRPQSGTRSPQTGTQSPRGGIVNTNLSSKVYSKQPATLLPDMHQLMLSPKRPSDATNKPTTPVTGLPPPGPSASSQARAMRAANHVGGSASVTSPRQSADSFSAASTAQPGGSVSGGFTSQAEELLARLRNVK